MDTKGYKSTFLPDTDYRIEDINKKKVFMQKILQNLKYFGQNVLTNKDTKRIYTPRAASKFKFQIPKAKKQGKTLYSKSWDSKSKVSNDPLLVNILQSATNNLVSGQKGETDRYTSDK